MANIDLKRIHRPHFTAKQAPAETRVPARPFLMIDGAGDPNTSDEYRRAVAALYPLAYGLRAAIRDATGDAYTVMPLEGLWWTEDWSKFDQNGETADHHPPAVHRHLTCGEQGAPPMSEQRTHYVTTSDGVAIDFHDR